MKFHLNPKLLISFFTICFSGMLPLFGAELSIKSYFSDGMVIQRMKPIVISGFGKVGSRVEVSFNGQKELSAVDENGEWHVELDPSGANSRPQDLVVSSASEKVKVKNVLIGDVLLHARQTSIDISLGRNAEGQSAAKKFKKDPNVRAISIKTIPSMKEMSDLPKNATEGWRTLDSDVALKMTASAFYIGKKLKDELDVPLGIVDLNMGPAFPVSWLSRHELEQTERLYGRTDIPGQLKRFDEAQEMAEAGDEIKPGGKSSLSADFVNYALSPAASYNATIAPMSGIAFKAMILQLGNDYPYMIYQDILESSDPFDREKLNIAYVQTYDIRKVGFRMESVTLPRVPRQWRKTLGDETLPIGLVVPPSSDLNTMGQHHREMRELQRLMAEDNPKVKVILPGYEYIRFSAQPMDDKLYASRCLQWLKADIYSKPGIVATGPLFEKADFSFNTATVHFKTGSAKGLKAEGDALEHFEVAGLLGDYFPAKASIEGEVIKIKSDKINRIARVRYNWKSHPCDELTNEAGMPTMPFRSELADHDWFVRNTDDDLPMEYSTPANEWPTNDVTLINGQLQKHGYFNFTGWVGPAGFLTGPFGPNMGVRKVKVGSPADGKLVVGDVIYSANGRMLGDSAWDVMSAAVTESETHAMGGKLTLGVRRGGKNIDVDLQIDVMGEYSPLAPYDCSKTEKIISNLEKWVVANGAKIGFLNNDAIFMLATGNPELQGYARRLVYDIVAKGDPDAEIDPRNAGKSWHNSAKGHLLGEYYMATGDPVVLPMLKNICDRLAATQLPIGGWRHNFPGGDHYGLIPNAGLPGVLGMHFAKEAGLDINLASYNLAVEHYARNRTETGFLIYGVGPLCEREVPVPFNPEVMDDGKMSSCNGGLGSAAILMKLNGRHRAANFASLICSYSWNSGYAAHGGDFWGNFWTPLGAHLHGKDAFVNYWKNRRWIRELNRMYDGGLIQSDSASVGAACGVALVAPRRRIQITGAPLSPFSVNAPEKLQPALQAYREKDYAKCVVLVDELLASGSIGKEEKDTVEYLGQQARDIQLSIEVDFGRIESLVKSGDYDEARSFLPSLSSIVSKDEKRIASLQETLSGKKTEHKKVDVIEEKVKEEEERKWKRLVSEILHKDGKHKGPAVVSGPESPNEWKLMVVEDIKQAPQGWEQSSFEDADWSRTQLPISWRMYHTALLRTTFTVEDKSSYDALRFYAWVFRQQGIQIYLNGQTIGKINNLEKKTGDIDSEFLEVATKHLKNGENTLAITTTHNWRWGMLFMKVYNDGFDFNLDARLSKVD